MKFPDISDILKASARIGNFIHKTPVLTSNSLDALTHSNLFFKCENLQKAGSFKMRGASNAVLLMSDDEAAKGVATHSSGNFAQALSLAAKYKNIKATIIMPNASPIAKIEAVKSYNGDIIFCQPTLNSREKTLNEFIEKSGAAFIHPYNNFNVIAGQGTAALELLNEISDLDIVIAPVGGGGLISGTSIAVKSLSNCTKVIAAEPKGADDAFRSVKAGCIIPSVNPKTIADGLLTSLGNLTFEIINKFVDEIVTVSEESIIKAMRLIWERMKIIIEPSAAVPLGAVLENKIDVKNKRTGIILSGGNLDLDRLPWLK